MEMRFVIRELLDGRVHHAIASMVWCNVPWVGSTWSILLLSTVDAFMRLKNSCLSVTAGVLLRDVLHRVPNVWLPFASFPYLPNKKESY